MEEAAQTEFRPDNSAQGLAAAASLRELVWAKRAERGIFPGEPPAGPPSATQKVELWAKEGGAEARRVTIGLRRARWPIKEAKGLHGSERLDALIAASNGNLPLVTDLAAAAEQHNMEVHGASTLSANVVVFGTANELAQLLPSFDYAHLSFGAVYKSLQYNGLTARQAILSDSFVANGFDANEGSNQNNGAVRVAVIETTESGPNQINDLWVGWQDDTGGATRIKNRQDCNHISCIPETSNNYNPNHGAKVAWVLAGSIEQGQDGYIGDADEQRRRSGQAKEAEIFYYATKVYGPSGIEDTSAAITNAIEEAILDEVDIINMSLGIKVGPGGDRSALCDPSFDAGGMNQAIRDAFDADIVVVVAAGNEHDGTLDCSITHPALRPEVLAVGAITDSLQEPYLGSRVGDYSARGGIPMTTLGIGSATTTNGVGLVAPGEFNYYPYWNFYFYELSQIEDTWAYGTSFASPVVAGSVALLKDALENNGYFNSNNNPGRMKACMLMLGDLFDDDFCTFLPCDDSTTNDTPGGNLVDSSGAGRLRSHHRNGSNLVDPSWWSMGTAYVNDGSGLWTMQLGTLPASAREIKFAAWWNEDDFTDVNDIAIGIIAGALFPIAMDITENLTKRAVYENPNLGGAQIQLAIQPTNTAGQTVPVYWCAYYHSDGSPDDLH